MASRLGTKLPITGKLLSQGQLRTLSHNPTTSFESAWAEILWGKTWAELGVPGYSAPRTSLNVVTPIEEDELPECPVLPGTQRHLLINLPLLQPKDGRVWLSSGSLPKAATLSPSSLQGHGPCSNYKPRPFCSIAQGAGNIAAAVSACLKVEEQRLKCAQMLMSEAKYDRAIIRLSLFDHLSHLLGSEFLDNDRFYYSGIESFLLHLDTWLEALLNTCDHQKFLILSTNGHADCIARINLNGLLWRGGFCRPGSEPSVMQAASRRASAFTALHGDVGAGTLAVTPSWLLDLPASRCGSPVQGAIYLNLKGRYSEGVVEREEARGLIKQVAGCISESIQSELGKSPHIWQCSEITPDGPELMVYADGVEFHNAAIGPPIDTYNKPRATHTCQGFVWLPPGCPEFPKPVMTTRDMYCFFQGADD